MVEAQKLSFFSDLCNMTSACAWNAVHSIFFIRIQDITLYLPCEPKKKQIEENPQATNKENIRLQKI